jgi:hypothetical protein
MILSTKPLLIAFLFVTINSYSQQRFFAEKAIVTFFSDAVVEDISATNEKVTSIFDVCEWRGGISHEHQGFSISE